jgi:SPX domain protein involved in polyphosphate accumulation
VSEPGLQLTPTEKLIELNDSYTSRLHLYGELVHDPTISVEESHG